VTEIPAIEREGVIQLPARGVLYQRYLVVDGRPALEIACDCATVTQHVFDIDPAALPAEVPLSCGGCQSTTWITVMNTRLPHWRPE